VKKQKYYLILKLRGKVFIVLASTVEMVEATMPMVRTHLLPNILLSLKPSLMVKPAQSMTRGAPTGV
jgi:hypothetical protein